ncbi:hypothetical protein KPL78_29925 [Roseomonas sp. HJA6]|uniref:Uncharacterized protein n=1 Tax=Roseomonas alba TaxID=2846776 RepID=A0ABS7AIF0_9PROT|nr:hypothetical protein [Neoroseomonas alba]MBW6402103.1 hypothetical protein [Neoroseomonas alba]
MILAHIDDSGAALGFYDPALHAVIPEGAIEISEEIWAAWIADTAGQRWDAVAGGLVPYTPPAVQPVPVVPRSISRRQLLLALHGAGLITDAEALAAATSGAVPAQVDAVFGALPPTDALSARITWATMSVAERAHPLIGMLITAELATAEEVDALFIDGATR